MGKPVPNLFYALAIFLLGSWVFFPNYFGGHIPGTKYFYEFIIAIVFVLVVLAKPGKIIYIFTKDTLTISVLLVVIFGIFGGMTRSNPAEELRQLGTHVVFHLLLYVSVVALSLDASTRLKIFKILLLFIICMTSLLLTSYLFPSNSYIEYLRQDPDRAYRYVERLETGEARFLGVFSNSVFTAVYGGYMSLVGVAIYQVGRPYGLSAMRKFLALALIVLGLICTFITFSRGPYIFLVITIGISWMFGSQGKKSTSKLIFRIGIFTLGLLVAYEYLQWIIEQRGGQEGVSTNIRLVIWAVTADIIYSFNAKELLFGAGYLRLYTEYGFRHAHNVYLNSLLVVGPVVLIPVATALIVRLRSIYKSFNSLAYSKISSADRIDKTILYGSMLMVLFLLLTGMTSVGPARDIRTITLLIVFFGMASGIVLNYRPARVASHLNS